MKPTDTQLSEITLRKYEHPGGLEGRELVRKICLSIGLLQPLDSRDVIVDILYSIILEGQLTSGEIETKVIEIRKEYKLTTLGASTPNIRRQIRRLKDIGLLEKYQGTYRIREGLSLFEAFTKYVRGELIENILQRVEQYLREVEKK